MLDRGDEVVGELVDGDLEGNVAVGKPSDGWRDAAGGVGEEGFAVSTWEFGGISRSGSAVDSDAWAPVESRSIIGDRC